MLFLYLFTMIIALLPATGVMAQSPLRGRVLDRDTRTPLAGVSVRVLGSAKLTVTDRDGHFQLGPVMPADSILFTGVGYQPFKVQVTSLTEDRPVLLVPISAAIEQVEINTGYYKLPKERATGSFVFIDSAEIHRIPGGNILERLRGLGSGLQFTSPDGNTASDIRIRGLATIESDEKPLIILDNFPYEGNIEDIDPNQVVNVTILKDAAAASIWGARAGNGVIVITTRQDRRDGVVNVSFRHDQSVRPKPDLFYGRDFLPSGPVMEFEKTRYGQGHFPQNNARVDPYYVELLRDLDQGSIDSSFFKLEKDRLIRTDVRREILDHLYRIGRDRTSSLSVNGGGPKYGFVVQARYGKNEDVIRGNSSDNLSLSFRNRFNPWPWLTIASDLRYGSDYTDGAARGMNSLLANPIGISPYQTLTDPDGNARSIPYGLSYRYTREAGETGLLDWDYRPLEEGTLTQKRDTRREIRINNQVSIQLNTAFNLMALYSYRISSQSSKTLHGQGSYYVRNLVNRYTQANGSLTIPNNAILLTGSPRDQAVHQFRLQGNYSREVADWGKLNLLAGAEASSSLTDLYPGVAMYNFNEELLTGTTQYNYSQLYDVRPSGRGRIPMEGSARAQSRQRDLSYYANASVSVYRHLNFSGSLRWDGSNLFGVKANQKGVPLWSLGGSWDLARQYGLLSGLFSSLKLRTTYGITGNVNRNVSHYPTIRYLQTEFPVLTAAISSYGNPSLRWEKVHIWNTAVDWSSVGGELSGSLEVYNKTGRDLISDMNMDPTSGISGSYKVNYASIRSQGVDATIGYKVQWGATIIRPIFNVSFVHNRVTALHVKDDPGIHLYLRNSPPMREGYSRDIQYAAPWHGLYTSNGQPVIYMDGHVSDRYSIKMRDYLNLDSLITVGTRIPRLFGTFMPRISYKGFEFSSRIEFKGQYVFRKGSMSPLDEYGWSYHQDYFKRWQQPGDENFTHVPAAVDLANRNADTEAIKTLYLGSDVLIERGDHIHVGDLTVQHSLMANTYMRRYFHSVTLGVSMKNPGFIWRRNKEGLDPDYGDTGFGRTRSLHFGVSCNF